MTAQSAAAAGPRPTRRLRRALRIVAIALAVLAVAAAGAAFWIHRQLAASLPQDAGQVAVAGLRELVTIARDALGVFIVAAASRCDVAFATGFLHGQERFFPMDL